MSGMTYEELRQLVRAGLNVTADSRTVTPGCVFVVVHGASEDGLGYVPSALKKGAAYVMADQETADRSAGLEGAQNAVWVAHADTRYALSELACDYYHTDEPGLTVVAVTGTNGKTTCASLLECLFKAQGHKVGVLGTVSYRWPGHEEASPLTTPGPMDVHRMLRAMRDAGCTVCVMEVSSHSLEQKRVRHVPFAGACFTNLTQDHLDFHVTMDAYFRAKALLFTETPKLDKAVALNADDEYALRLLDVCPDAWTYGFGPCPAKGSPERHLQGELLEHGTSGVVLRMTGGSRTWELKSPLIGRFNADNLLTAQAMALAMGLDDFSALENFRGVPGRLERVDNAAGRHVFVDYAHTPDALVNVLSALRGAGFTRIVTVFGCGGNRDRTKRPKMGQAVAALSDVAVLTSDNPRFEKPEDIIADVMPGLKDAKEVVVDADRRSATQKALDLLKDPVDCLLIAGKGHEDYQIVNGVKRHYSDQETVRELLGA